MEDGEARRGMDPPPGAAPTPQRRIPARYGTKAAATATATIPAAEPKRLSRRRGALGAGPQSESRRSWIRGGACPGAGWQRR